MEKLPIAEVRVAMQPHSNGLAMNAKNCIDNVFRHTIFSLDFIQTTDHPPSCILRKPRS
jgi:hypothetical protein